MLRQIFSQTKEIFVLLVQFLPLFCLGPDLFIDLLKKIRGIVNCFLKLPDLFFLFFDLIRNSAFICVKFGNFLLEFCRFFFYTCNVLLNK